MKTPNLCLLVVLVAGATFAENASTVLASDTKVNPETWTVSERGSNFRIWEKTEYELTPDGQQVPKIHRVTELATGMHYKETPTGPWLESKEEIKILPAGAGAAASEGQQKVLFPPDIYSGQIELNTADGKWLRSRVMGLGYFDLATGQSVLLAETTNSIGEIYDSNVIIYPDAFDGDCRADIRYTYRLSGVEQDIILRTSPEPSQYGLNPETTVLQVFTEFFSPPEPGIRRENVRSAVEVQESDDTLDFGAVKIGRGRAFALGGEHRLQDSVRVRKHWLNLQGRQWLIEEVPVREVSKELEKLPQASQGAQNSRGSEAARRTASREQIMPPTRVVTSSTNQIKLAMNSLPMNGFVLDYSATSSTTNFTFLGDTTYYVNGVVNLSGTVVIEGNTVIKFNPATAGWIWVDSSVVDCQTSAYRPAVFTSMHDNSVGETISGSTGSPNAAADQNYYFATQGSSAQDLKHLRMLYCYCGVTIIGGNARLSDLQFNHAQYPIYTVSSPTCKVLNALMSDVTETVFEINDGKVDAENITADRCKYLSLDDWNATLSVSNSLFVSVTNWGMSFSGSYNATNAGGAVFQSVGAGMHYLATNSIYRNVGTTNIDAGLLTQLKSKTTYPPVVYSNTTIVAATSFSPQAARDTDTPDLGYHYDPLDYVFGGVRARSDLTFTSGTAAAWFELPGAGGPGYGLYLTNGMKLTASGTVTDPCYFVRYSTVMEGGNGLWMDRGWLAFITGQGSYVPSLPSQLITRFTSFSHLAGDPGHFRDYYAALLVSATHCELWGSFGGYNLLGSYTNCLFYRASFWQGTSDPNPYAIFRNCTFHGGSFGITHWEGGAPYWYSSIRDCAYDGVPISIDNPSGGNPLYVDYDYNAFLQGATRTAPQGTHDVIVTNSFNWQNSWLGNFYLPTNSPLINTGSFTNAGLAGLYHFTTQTNQMKETNSVVDIGCHYVATDANGVPLDHDGDGISDYLEDGNGNGAVDSGETGWQSATDLGLKVWITRPRNNSLIP